MRPSASNNTGKVKNIDVPRVAARSYSRQDFFVDFMDTEQIVHKSECVREPSVKNIHSPRTGPVEPYHIEGGI